MALIHSDKDSFKADVLDYKGKVLVDFFAQWCGPCKMLGPVLEKYAEKHPDLKIVKVDVDECPDIASSYGVMSIPTLIVFNDGEAVNQALGFRNETALDALLGY